MITLANRQENCPPAINTGEWHSVEVADTQTIGLRYYEPTNVTRPNDLLIDGIAWSVHATKPRDVWRTGATAEATGMRTIGLEMPGMGPNSGPITNEQLRGLADGDWTAIGEAQWTAILNVLDQKDINIDGMTIHFDGNSMSVSSNIGLIAAAPENVKIGNIIAWEGVAWQPKSRIASIANIGGIALRAPSMAMKMASYQKLAGTIPEEIGQTLSNEVIEKPNSSESRLKKIGHKIGSWIMPVVAMANGKDALRLIEGLRGRDTSKTVIHLWNGEKSLVSRTKANEFGAQLMRNAGLQVSAETDEDGRHLVEDNIPLSLERKLSVLSA